VPVTNNHPPSIKDGKGLTVFQVMQCTVCLILSLSSSATLILENDHIFSPPNLFHPLKQQRFEKRADHDASTKHEQTRQHFHADILKPMFILQIPHHLFHLQSLLSDLILFQRKHN
jgi:hypothetical protein